MPRLGRGEPSDEEAPGAGVSSSSSSATRREATAYANDRGRRSILLYLITIFVVGRVLLHDYRKDAQIELLSSGLSKDEVDRYIPPTAEERRNYAKDQKNDLNKMKQDIAYLLEQVHELKQIVNETKAGPK